ncbi:ABC transporter permease [Pseudomonas sp. MS-1(2024)]|nr:ABC transporter permease [Pseudomonas sp. MS-1(2024)]MEC4169403.1 ABC transporter permease [Pseudomonas sp. MS-1(2024)]
MLPLNQAVEDALDSFRTLSRRSALALLGIVIGSASIVAIINIGHNAGLDAASIFQGMGTDTLVAQLPDKEDAQVSLLSIDAAKIEGLDLPGLQITPTVFASISLVFNNRSVNARLVGTESSLFDVITLSLLKGRFLHEFDREENVVVLGHQVAVSLSEAGSRIQVGDWLNINNYLFKVVGILKSKTNSIVSPVVVDDSVFISLHAISRVESQTALRDLIVRVPPPLNIEIAALRLHDQLARAFEFRSVQIMVPQQIIEGMNRQNRTFHYLLIALGAIALVGGGVAVMNVMYMNVSERRVEIGLRMAIGARRQDIRNLFLIEALALSTLGAVLGAGVGIALAWLYAVISGWAFELAMLSIPLGVLSTLLVGVFFGLKPAIAASRLTPVEALRDY